MMNFNSAPTVRAEGALSGFVNTTNAAASLAQYHENVASGNGEPVQGVTERVDGKDGLRAEFNVGDQYTPTTIAAKLLIQNGTFAHDYLADIPGYFDTTADGRTVPGQRMAEQITSIYPAIDSFLAERRGLIAIEPTVYPQYRAAIQKEIYELVKFIAAAKGNRIEGRRLPGQDNTVPSSIILSTRSVESLADSAQRVALARAATRRDNATTKFLDE